MLLNGQKFVAFYKQNTFLTLSNSDIVEQIYLFNFSKRKLEKGVKYVQRRRSYVFIFNFKHISQLFSAFILLTLNKYQLVGSTTKSYHLIYPNFSFTLFLRIKGVFDKQQAFLKTTQNFLLTSSRYSPFLCFQSLFHPDLFTLF